MKPVFPRTKDVNLVLTNAEVSEEAKRPHHGRGGRGGQGKQYNLNNYKNTFKTH